ncbi:AAA family ATPase [Hominenteromicrobium sp.]|uniref:AAA family ATPase n=1 Tax=Hominenteromicrobium sp. TaxID=3073581 RepID=UPI003A8F353D
MTYTQAQIDRANAVSLEDFLRTQGETLIKSGREYRWKEHDSLTVRGNKWFRHSRSRGGYPIDFVMEFYGKSFPEAVRLLTGESGDGQSEAGTAPPTEFRLPLHGKTNDRAIQYLCESRGISKQLAQAFLLSGDIYEDAKRHSVVFVGRDRSGIPRYAHVRGTADPFRQDVAGSDKSYPFRYEGKGDQLFVFEAPIDLLSFLCLYPQDWQSRSYIALGGVSGKALDRFLAERRDIRKVFLCLDSDAAGNEACTRLLQEIPAGIAVMRLVPAMKDWNDVLRQQGEIPNRKFIAETIPMRELPKAQPVPMLRMADVELAAVDWLWFPYIPFGKLTIIQGNPGEGKTYFAMRLAAACTNRKPLPNMPTLEPFNVIYQTAEDGLGDTVKPRLLEADADLEKVLVIDDRDAPLTLTDERLARAIRENNARLVIIDPVQAFLGADVDMNRANEVRPIFRSLGDVAQATGCAIVLIGHLNKAAGTQSTYRGLGSIDITAAVRSLLFIGKLKDSPTTRVLVHEKSSLAPPGQSLAFSLGDEKGFAWIGAYDVTADELLAGTDTTKAENKTAQAETLILELLADGKRLPSAELEKAVNDRGISSRTLRTAKSRIGDRLVTERNGAGWVCYLR